MNESKKEWTDRFDELAAALGDGSMTPEQSAELTDLLGSQPGARRRLAQLVQLQSLLADGELSSDSAVPDHATRSESAVGSAGFNPTGIKWLLAIAATGLLAMFAWNTSGWRSGKHIALESNSFPTTVMDDGVAVITKMVGVTWEGDSVKEVGSSVSPGILKLSEGLVQFEFYRGAVVVAEGPAELEFTDADKLFCHRGKLRVRVPLQAQGFVVLSPHFELVDLGTEFGVLVADDGSGNVQVYDGKVELYDLGSNRAANTRREVLADQNVLVSKSGAYKNTTTDTEAFVSSATLKRCRAARMHRKWTAGKPFVIKSARIRV